MDKGRNYRNKKRCRKTERLSYDIYKGPHDEKISLDEMKRIINEKRDLYFKESASNIRIIENDETIQDYGGGSIMRSCCPFDAKIYILEV